LWRSETDSNTLIATSAIAATSDGHHHPRPIRRENTTVCRPEGIGTPANSPLICTGFTRRPSMCTASSGVSFSDDASRNGRALLVKTLCSAGLYSSSFTSARPPSTCGAFESVITASVAKSMSRRPRRSLSVMRLTRWTA